MQKANLVMFEKRGRIKIINLTENGARVAEHIEKIRGFL
jgi:predicted MarR family transcription regulator